jgi:hypothetical protein
MGLLDAFRKDEVVGAKVLVCALGAKFDDLRKNDERICKRFYPATASLTANTLTELESAVRQGADIVHLFCAVDSQGAIEDAAGSRIAAAALLQACVDSGVKLLWIASDNPAASYNAGFKPKGIKLNIVLTERRLGPLFSLFLDSFLTRLSAGDSFSKVWNVVSKPEGKSVQPDVPQTIVSLGRGGVILRP